MSTQSAGLSGLSEGLVQPDGTITPQARVAILYGLELLQAAVVLNNAAKGWRPIAVAPDARRNFGELMHLVTTELAEAFESYRAGEPDLWFNYSQYGDGAVPVAPHGWNSQPSYPDNEQDGRVLLGKPEGIAAEVADAIIRLLDVADEYNLPVFQALFHKHAYNQTRPYRHGNKRA